MKRLMALGLLVMAVGGCAMFSGKSTGPLIADSRSPISDVPVPAGFSMSSESSSRVVSGTSVRVVDHKYSGGDEVLMVVNFYKEKLPGKEWTFVDMNQITGKEVILHFTKRNEECHVYVSKHLLDTQIRVKIDPVSSAAAK